MKTLAARNGALDYAILFYLISFWGWCTETILFLVRWGKLADRGFLTLPFCAIYGTAVLAVHFLLGTPQKGRLAPLFDRASALPRGKKRAAQAGVFALYFLLACLPPALLELAVGVGFRSALHVRLWDYGYQKFQLFGSVSLSFTFLWGGLITLGMATAWEPLCEYVRSLPRTFKRAAVTSLTVCVLADLAFNLIYLLVTGSHLKLF